MFHVVFFSSGNNIILATKTATGSYGDLFLFVVVVVIIVVVVLCVFVVFVVVV